MLSLSHYLKTYNFTCLFKLLGITIQHEKPQLEVQKTELLRKEEELKVQLAELEESLLEVETTKIYKTYLRWPNTVFKCLCLIHHHF